jgi:hypothetical protein
METSKALALYQDGFSLEIQEGDTQKVVRVKQTLGHVMRLGMKKAQENLVLYLMKTLLQENLNVSICKFRRHRSLRPWRWQIGSVQQRGIAWKNQDGREWYRKYALQKFDGAVPLEILERIPDEYRTKLDVFEEKHHRQKVRDPYLAIDVGKGVYIVLAQWR